MYFKYHLKFSFRINRIESPIRHFDGDCGESLTIYDAAWPDDSKIIKTFCDTFSRAMEKHDFVSSTESLFVRFESKTGSYSGSSLYYWAHYDFFDDRKSGEPLAGMNAQNFSDINLKYYFSLVSIYYFLCVSMFAQARNVTRRFTAGSGATVCCAVPETLLCTRGVPALGRTSAALIALSQTNAFLAESSSQ
jgi:hypothetical protein